VAYSQKLVKATELLSESKDFTGANITLNQDIRIDSLLTRHIVSNGDYNGIDGFRIQIYRGSNRNAREEANKVKAEFISEFPDINSYLDFDKPNLFKVKVGDFRTKHDAYPYLIKIKRKFPNSYILGDIINYPELEK
jgi:hypothetical protein